MEEIGEPKDWGKRTKTVEVWIKVDFSWTLLTVSRIDPDYRPPNFAVQPFPIPDHVNDMFAGELKANFWLVQLYSRCSAEE